LAYEINYLVTQPTKTLLTRPHSPTLGSKTANTVDVMISLH